MSKQVGDFFKFLWPFQKSWTGHIYNLFAGMAVIRQGLGVLSRLVGFNFSSMNNFALVIRDQVSSDPSLVGKSTLGFISRRFQVLICIKVLGFKIRNFQTFTQKEVLTTF